MHVTPGLRSAIQFLKYLSGLERELSTQMLVWERVMPEFQNRSMKCSRGDGRARFSGLLCCTASLLQGYRLRKISSCSLRTLRPSAISAFEALLNAEIAEAAEGRRETLLTPVRLRRCWSEPSWESRATV